MRRFLLAIVLMTFPLVGFGCVGTSLPKDRPSDLEIRWAEGGGESMESDDVTITATKATRTFYELVDGDIQKRVVNFIPTSKDLDALYAVIRNNGVDTLKQNADEVSDSDNTSIRLSWGDNDADISAAQVPDSQMDRFRNAYDAIGAYVNEKAP